MLRMTPLTVEGKPLDVATRLAELTGLVETAARDGLPAHVLEQSLWRQLLRLGHDLQAAYFALAGDGDCGATLPLADGRVVKRWPEPHCRPYRSIFGDSTRAPSCRGPEVASLPRGFVYLPVMPFHSSWVMGES